VRARQRAAEKSDQVLHLLRHALGARVFAVHQSERGARIAARRAAQAQIDPPGNKASSMRNCSAIFSGL